MAVLYYESQLCHHGIKGQKWGIRRYQNPDGSLTLAGKKRYGSSEGSDSKNDRKWDESKFVKKTRYITKKWSPVTRRNTRIVTKVKEELTDAGKAHIEAAKAKAAEYIESNPEPVKQVKRSYNRYLDSMEPMRKFLDDEPVSRKYIKDWLKIHPVYEEEPDYDFSEAKGFLLSYDGAGYEFGPFINYANDRGINWKELKTNARKSYDENINTVSTFTKYLRFQYGDTNHDTTPTNRALEWFVQDTFDADYASWYDRKKWEDV